MSEFDPFEASLRKVEPAVRLVPVRHLRKLLHYLRDHGRAVPSNASRPLWASREELLAADSLSPSVFSGTEDPLLIATAPDDRAEGRTSPAEQLREYWRLLFQAAVLKTLDDKLASRSLTPADCSARLARLGSAAVREIRYVLEFEHLLVADADDALVYRTFAATYLDLHVFAPESLADFFSSLPPSSEVLQVLSFDVDEDKLLERTRLPGSAERTLANVPHSAMERPSVDLRSSEGAAEAEKKGNFVRAAILRMKAGESASDTLGKLVGELAGVLQWNEATQREWQEALGLLLERAARGTWPPAARCLYELQKIPSDLAREVFAVDLVEPIRTLGRRPMKRPLPHARDVMLLRKIRAAHKQLLRSGLEKHSQASLDELFHRQMHAIEHTIRHKLAPIISTALKECGFKPASRVEEVAKEKLVAELLDRVCERGYLRFGNLRDAVARNQLKMADLSGPGELLRGDPLLQVDTRLAYDLDGIYRRGEVYLRFLQRGSSLFFGTQSGRWLFLYLIAPFLAAFLALTFAIELQHIGGKISAFASKVLAPKQVLRPAEVLSIVSTGEQGVLSWDDDGQLVWTERHLFDWNDEGYLAWNTPEESYDWDDNGFLTLDAEKFGDVVNSVATSSASKSASGEHHESSLPDWEPVFVLGIFLLLLFHVPAFRRAFFSVVVGLGTVLHQIFWVLPLGVLRSRIVVAIRYSAPMRFLARYLLAAVVVTLCIVLMLSFFGASPSRALRWGGFILAGAMIVFNTPWGWDVQERLAESVSDGWRVFRVNFLPGLVATVLDWFRRLANWIERQLYEVDEWLRYRGGDSGGSLVLKATLGLFWFPFAYLARFAFYLLLEPQVNPVKHFPVVTVSHKVILPLTPNLADALNVSNPTAFWVLAGVPGVFGFIAWELLANWQLYSANRSLKLKPVVIGSHGETMRGLLRPGFHSGTVPKLYRKLRRAVRRGDRAYAVRLHHDLHHAEEGVRWFFERELIGLLHRDPAWSGVKLAVAEVRFGCQRVVVSFEAPSLTAARFEVAVENRDGRISANCDTITWRGVLTALQLDSLLAALRGLFDMSAAELVDDRERVSDAPGTDLLHHYSWNEWVQRWGAGGLQL